MNEENNFIESKAKEIIEDHYIGKQDRVHCNFCITKSLKEGIQKGREEIQCDECRTTPHEIIGGFTVLCKSHLESRRWKWIGEGRELEREKCNRYKYCQCDCGKHKSDGDYSSDLEKLKEAKE